MANRKLLELQSDRIEMVLMNHKSPAHVTGGVVTPRAVQFYLMPALGTRLNKVQSLSNEIALALGVTSVRISRQGGAVQLEIPREDAQTVKLLPLMDQLSTGRGAGKPHSFTREYASHTPLPPFTTVLGLCDDGAPLLLRLSSPDVAHVLISGTTGSGKTALCQTMLLSLVVRHRRSQLQLVLIDPKQRAFAPFAQLPHLLRPVIGNAAEAIDALNELVRLMEARGHSGQVEPRVVVVLDELADLAQTGGKALSDPLLRLAQRGREAGLHVIACTQKPSSQVMGTLTRANFPARLVGKVVSPDDARVAAGIGGTGAEKLAGRGDFIAVAAGQVVRFQAAYAKATEVSQIVSQLNGAPRAWNVPMERPNLLHQAAAFLARAA